jgi:hypothetical protein
MPPETSFIERLQSHVGRIVNVLCERYSNLTHGQLGLLVRARGDDVATAWVDLLIGGRVRTLYIHPGDLELIGADDA